MIQHRLICGYVLGISALFLGQSLQAEITFLNSLRRSFRTPIGVAISPADALFVGDVQAQRVEKLDATGMLDRSFFVQTPRDVAVSPVLLLTTTGSTTRPVFVVDRDNHQIRRFSETGSFQLGFGSMGTDPGEFNLPLGIGMNGLGDVFVADTGNNRIQRFDIDGTFQAAFGTPGTGAGEFDAPTDVAVGDRGEIFVADRNNNRIQKFDNDGNFEFALGGFDDPTSLAISAADHLYVVDRDNNRVQRFGLDGAFQATFGSFGSGDGQLDQPLGIDVGPEGMIFVADSNNNRVTRYFDPDAWVLGRNEFVDAAAGPIDVGIGSPSFFQRETFRRVLLGQTFDLDTLQELVVGRNTRIALDGELTISGGALITDTLQVDGRLVFESGRLELADQGIDLGADGPFGDRITVGLNSVIKLGDALVVGASRDSRLSIRDGGIVETSAGTIAVAAGTVSTVTVQGFGSTWSNSGALVIGDAGTAGLTVADGARVQSSSGVLAADASAEALVTVTGFGSRWSSTGDLALGAAGEGLLSIQTGGLVENNAAAIGSAMGRGTVVLEGTGSRWINLGSLAVGSGPSATGGSGQLHIGPSTSVLVGQDMSILDNGNTDVVGALRITGSGSVQDGGSLFVDRGSVTATGLEIRTGGALVLNGGDVTLTGALTNAGRVQLAGDLAPEVTAARIVNSGLLRGGARLGGTLENAASGAIRLDAGNELFVSGAGSVNNGEIDLQGATIEFASSLDNSPSGSIIGRGSLRAGTRTTNRGLMTFSGGQTDVHGEFLNSGSDALVLATGGGTTTFFDNVTNQGGELRVSEGSSMVFLSSFNGGTTGQGNAIIEGVLSPGNSPAQVRFDGDLVLRPGSRTVLELGGPRPGQEHDQILVGATMHLEGTARLQPLDGYEGPTTRGQIVPFVLMSAEGGRSGVFDEIQYGDATQLEPLRLSDSVRAHFGSGLFRTVNYTDQTFELTEYLALEGDTDGDFRVGFNDFLVISANFGERGDWTAGDIDGNNLVQFPDYLLLAANFGRSATTTAATVVPEPGGASLCFMACAAGALLGATRGRRFNNLV